MKRLIAVILVALSVSNPAYAQSFAMERLTDWKFRFYACKHAVIHASLTLRLLNGNDVTQRRLDMVQQAVGPVAAEMVVANEAAIQFSEAEAEFVSDLSFAVLSGMLAGSYELTPTSLIAFGSDICVAGFDSLVR